MRTARPRRADARTSPAPRRFDALTPSRPRARPTPPQSPTEGTKMMMKTTALVALVALGSFSASRAQDLMQPIYDPYGPDEVPAVTAGGSCTQNAPLGRSEPGRGHRLRHHVLCVRGQHPDVLRHEQ